jgi:hypothetical protein
MRPADPSPVTSIRAIERPVDRVHQSRPPPSGTHHATPLPVLRSIEQHAPAAVAADTRRQQGSGDPSGRGVAMISPSTRMDRRRFLGFTATASAAIVSPFAPRWMIGAQAAPDEPAHPGKSRPDRRWQGRY